MSVKDKERNVEEMKKYIGLIITSIICLIALLLVIFKIIHLQKVDVVKEKEEETSQNVIHCKTNKVPTEILDSYREYIEKDTEISYEEDFQYDSYGKIEKSYNRVFLKYSKEEDYKKHSKTLKEFYIPFEKEENTIIFQIDREDGVEEWIVDAIASRKEEGYTCK